MKIKSLLAVFSLFPFAIFAAYPASEKTIFHCTTAQQKQVQVCDSHSHIEYKFGKNLI